MTFVIPPDRVMETSTTSGSSGSATTLTLNGAVTSFASFGTAVGTGKQTYYEIVNAAGDFETGKGTVGGSGPYTLSRDTLLNSSTGTWIALSGTSTVFAGWPSCMIPYALYAKGASTWTIDAPSFTQIDSLILTLPASSFDRTWLISVTALFTGNPLHSNLYVDGTSVYPTISTPPNYNSINTDSDGQGRLISFWNIPLLITGDGSTHTVSGWVTDSTAYGNRIFYDRSITAIRVQ